MDMEDSSWLLILDVAWWLSFVSAMGLAVGSFLNVVIYRLPLGLSVNRPVSSFCPACGHKIRWYDNIPVLSYLLLKGRCRDCSSPISVRYPMVEMLFAFIALLLLDTFIVAHGRSQGLLWVDRGLSWQVFTDGPIVLAHVILFAALLAMSAIDMEYYWVDIRVTHLAAAAGFILHALWTPRSSASWPRPSDGVAIVCLAALAGLGLTVIVARLWATRMRVDLVDDEVTDSGSDPAAAVPVETDSTASPPFSESNDGKPELFLPLLLLGLFVVLWLSSFSQGAGWSMGLPFSLRAGIPLALLFGVMIWQSAIVRESDAEVFDAIQAESSSARLVSLGELAYLLPTVLLLVVTATATASPVWAEKLNSLLHWNPLGEWRPLWGLGTAAAGYVIGGAVGWLVRILFTLLLGKEALGTGDIHILAAAGAVAGWPVAVGGFVLASLLALAGMILVFPFKRSRTIPLGPWLSLAFLILVVFYEPLRATPTAQNVVEVFQMLTGADFAPSRAPWPPRN